MQRSTLVVLIILLAAIGAGVVTFMVLSEHRVRPGGALASSTPNLRGQAIFTDGEHGFSLYYPEKFQTDYTFSSYYHLPANWRVASLPDATGTPIISIVSYRIENEKTYPRYFDAEVRIGASHDPKELARCLVASADNGEVAQADVVLGGTTFKSFSFAGAGMMQYVKGLSYRAIHNGSCIAVEQVQTGSSYREDPKSFRDIPDSVLDAKYRELDAVVKTFTFVGQ